MEHTLVYGLFNGVFTLPTPIPILRRINGLYRIMLRISYCIDKTPAHIPIEFCGHFVGVCVGLGLSLSRCQAV